MKTYKTLDSKQVYSCKVFDVLEDKVLLPNEREATRYTLLHPGAVVILPRLKREERSDTLLMIEQYRHSVGRCILEFPAGTLEVGESAINCAKREICEEVGYSAAHWESLGSLLPAPGFCNEVQHLYFADRLRPQKLAGDDDEIIEVVEMSVSQIEAAIMSGDIVDAKSIALYTRAKLAGLIVSQ